MSLFLDGKKAEGKYWKTQLPVDYIDTSLTINTYENVSADLSGGKPAKLIYIQVEQTNNGLTAETIVLEVTINGTAYEFTAALDSGSKYYCRVTESLSASDFATQLTATVSCVGTALDNTKNIPLTAKSVGLIRVKQTTSVDATSAQIEVNIIWEKLVDVTD